MEYKAETKFLGNSLVVEWLRIGAFAAVSLGSVSGWGTKISQAVWYLLEPENQVQALFLRCSDPS